MAETTRTIELIIDEHFDSLFDELCHHPDASDSFDELLIEVTIPVDGKTIRRSWKDRNRMLSELEQE